MIEMFWRNRMFEPYIIESFRRNITLTQFLGLMLLVPIVFGTAFHKDRASKTLDQLLITALSSFEIALLAWLPRLVQFLFLGLSYVGIWSILQMRTQIGWLQLLAIYIASLPVLIAFSAYCLWLSARCRNTQTPVILGYITLLGYWLIALYQPSWPTKYQDMSGFSDRIFAAIAFLEELIGPLSVAQHFYRPFDEFGHDLWRPIASFVAIYLSVGILFLFLTARELKHERRPKSVKAFRRYSISIGTYWERLPVAWRDLTFKDYRTSGRRFNSFTLLLAIITLMPFALTGYWKWYDSLLDAQLSVTRLASLCWIAIMYVIVIMVAIRAGLSVETERRTDTWEALLASPLSAAEIVFGKYIGALQPAIPGLVSLLPLLVAFSWIERSTITGVALAIVSVITSFGLSCAIGTASAFMTSNGRSALIVTVLVVACLHGVGQSIIVQTRPPVPNRPNLISAADYEAKAVARDQLRMYLFSSVAAPRPLMFLLSHKPSPEFAIGRDFQTTSLNRRQGYAPKRLEQFNIRGAGLLMILLEILLSAVCSPSRSGDSTAAGWPDPVRF